MDGKKSAALHPGSQRGRSSGRHRRWGPPSRRSARRRHPLRMASTGSRLRPSSQAAPSQGFITWARRRLHRHRLLCANRRRRFRTRAATGRRRAPSFPPGGQRRRGRRGSAAVGFGCRSRSRRGRVRRVRAVMHLRLHRDPHRLYYQMEYFKEFQNLKFKLKFSFDSSQNRKLNLH